MAATRHIAILLALLGWLPGQGAFAAVLPEDRSDALFHTYDGGGVQVNGPSILIRKAVGESVSLSVNYYVDSISSASIDVITQASPYTEKRMEHSFSMDYLHGESTMSLAYTTSTESDYDANTASFSISQDLFGDLTTVTLGYSRGMNEVRKNNDPAFQKELKTHSYRVGVSQVLSKNLLLVLAYETIADEGYLNNPYRSVRYLDSNVARGYSYQGEVYPNTRTSNSVSLRARYYLPYRAVIHAGTRLFADSWGIQATDYEIGYVHPYRDNWIFELRYRSYSQSHASFYSDLFAQRDAQNFLARDKELSTFSDQTIGLEASYEILKNGWSFFNKGSINLAYDRIFFDYQDFRDLTAGGSAGQEPLYSFTANVFRLYLSLWY